MCGIECKSRSLVLQLQSAEVSRKVTSSFVWSWTISLTLNERIQCSESWTQYSSFVQHYSLFIHNKLQYTWRGDYCGFVRPAQLPVLTWSSNTVPPGTKTLLRSPPGPRRIRQMIITTAMQFRILPALSLYERALIRQLYCVQLVTEHTADVTLFVVRNFNTS